jgi:hypothetical protein
MFLKKRSDKKFNIKHSEHVLSENKMNNANLQKTIDPISISEKKETNSVDTILNHKSNVESKSRLPNFKINLNLILL